MVGSCGANSGVSARKIMAKIGTNKLWSKYSLKGRKSKLAFKDLAICRIIISKMFKHLQWKRKEAKKNRISWMKERKSLTNDVFYLTLSPSFAEACLRVHKKVSEVEVEEHIAEYLKHAPNKPGGIRHKVNKPICIQLAYLLISFQKNVVWHNVK